MGAFTAYRYVSFVISLCKPCSKTICTTPNKGTYKSSFYNLRSFESEPCIVDIILSKQSSSFLTSCAVYLFSSPCSCAGAHTAHRFLQCARPRYVPHRIGNDSPDIQTLDHQLSACEFDQMCSLHEDTSGHWDLR